MLVLKLLCCFWTVVIAKIGHYLFTFAFGSFQLSTPLTISFELPVPGGIIPDNNIEYVKGIEEKFKIQVIFSSKSKIHVLLVSVKGSERDATNVQDATRFLAIYMCGKV